MSDERLSDNDGIHAALQLDGDPDKVRRYYDDWARRYNLDVGSADYSGPRIAAGLLRRHLGDESASLLDAGCGTGLVGVELRALGYACIDGFDLSSEMATRAQATGAYRRVDGGIDIMKAASVYADAAYDALLCVGVFTLGHVPPEALPVLLELVRDDGVLVISTRSHYYDRTDFQGCVDRLLGARRMAQLEVIRDGPYNHDGGAHYWVFRKTA